MVQQIRDAQISVKLDVEGAKKQAKNLSRSIRQNRIDLGTTEKEAEKVKEETTEAKGVFGKIKGGAAAIRNKAQRFGYRGIKQAPDLVTGQIQGIAAGIGMIPLPYTDAAAEVYKFLAPHAEYGDAILEGMYASLMKGVGDEVKEGVELVMETQGIWLALKAQAATSRELRIQTDSLQQMMTGTGAAVGAQMATGLKQTIPFYTKVMHAELEIGEAQSRLRSSVLKLQREFFFKNIADATVMEMFAGKGTK
jgi:hypothetical protein